MRPHLKRRRRGWRHEAVLARQGARGPRLQQVYDTLLRYGYDSALTRAPVLGSVHHAMQTWTWRLPKGWEEPSTAVKLRLLLEELGPPT